MSLGEYLALVGDDLFQQRDVGRPARHGHVAVAAHAEVMMLS